MPDGARVRLAVQQPARVRCRIRGTCRRDLEGAANCGSMVIAAKTRELGCAAAQRVFKLGGVRGNCLYSRECESLREHASVRGSVCVRVRADPFFGFLMVTSRASLLLVVKRKSWGATRVTAGMRDT